MDECIHEKKNNIIAFGALVLTSLSTTAFASTSNASNKETIKIGSLMTQEQVEKSNAFLAKYPNLVNKNHNNNLKNDSNPLLTNLSVTSNGSATPLSSYYTLFVACNYDSSTETINNQLVHDKRLKFLMLTDLKASSSYRIISIAKILISHLTELKENRNASDLDYVVLDKAGQRYVPRSLSMNFTKKISKYEKSIEDLKKNKSY